VKARALPAIAVAILAVLAGCGGSGKPSRPKPTAPPLEQGLPWANAFVHRLVVVGRWKGVANDINPLFKKQLRTFLSRSGVKKVLGPGKIRHDCNLKPSVGAGHDCIDYRLRGTQFQPISGQVRTINGTLTLWLDWLGDNRWRVLVYDYTAKIT